MLKNSTHKKSNILDMKVNNLENEIPKATILIRINQYTTGKQWLEQKSGDVDKKILPFLI